MTQRYRGTFHLTILADFHDQYTAPQAHEQIERELMAVLESHFNSDHAAHPSYMLQAHKMKLTPQE